LERNANALAFVDAGREARRVKIVRVSVLGTTRRFIGRQQTRRIDVE
tara:strand:+ start:2546 stop:2686 length:141 start_codon:yes stop_codon:yes gene_type:complete